MSKQKMKAMDICKIYLKINQSETIHVSAIRTHSPRDQLDNEDHRKSQNNFASKLIHPEK